MFIIRGGLMEQTITDEVEEFLQRHPKSHFLQSAKWASVKDNWKHEFITVRNENGAVIGTMSILLRKVPILNRYMMYAPRGFVCDKEDKETLKKLTIEAKKIAKRYHAFIFRLDPDIPKEDKEFRQTMEALRI